MTKSKDDTSADNKAAMERTENVQPTPTQAENDAAREGFDSIEELDDKEADGSPVEGESKDDPKPAAPAPAPKKETGAATFKE